METQYPCQDGDGVQARAALEQYVGGVSACQSQVNLVGVELSRSTVDLIKFYYSICKHTCGTPVQGEREGRESSGEHSICALNKCKQRLCIEMEISSLAFTRVITNVTKRSRAIVIDARDFW